MDPQFLRASVIEVDPIYEVSAIPDGFKDRPCMLGVDEAGRGPVLGPQVYSCAFWAVEDDKAISARGYDDSKALKEEERNSMYRAITEKEKHRIGFGKGIMTPDCISSAMLAR